MCKSKLKKMRRAPDLYRGLFEASPDALVIAEQDGTIVDANKAANVLFSYERADLLGSNIRNLCASLDEYERFRGEIEREEFVRDFAATFRTRAGHRFDSLITASIWRAADGTSVGYQGVIRKISQHKRMERHIEKLQTLAAKLLIDREHERVSLGSALHDSIGQMLEIGRAHV